MTKAKQLTDLAENCICFSTHTCSVRIDDNPEEVEQTYLVLDGTPEGFRWLARHLESMAKSAERHGGCGNIVAPREFKNRPVKLDGWDSFEFQCRQ